MKWLKKLDNPFLLALHGFVAGAILVFATADSRPDRSAADAEALTLILTR